MIVFTLGPLVSLVVDVEGEIEKVICDLIDWIYKFFKMTLGLMSCLMIMSNDVRNVCLMSKES